MNRSMLKMTTGLLVVIVAFSFMAGCGSKSIPTETHSESGTVMNIMEEIYNDCLERGDTEGAEEVLETYLHLVAFYCLSYTTVKYDDMKYRHYENIDCEIGDLQIAIAAYNEYNDESAMDVEVDWILHYNTCTKEQLGAIEGYVNWYHTQKGIVLIGDYRDLVSHKYDEIKQNNDIPHPPAYDRLTPAQFMEVQKYMADPDYQVDTTVWK